MQSETRRMRKWLIAVKVAAIISGLFLISDFLFDFGQRFLHSMLYRYLWIVIISFAYAAFLVHFYKTGNTRKLRELILIAIILFMVSVLAYFIV